MKQTTIIAIVLGVLMLVSLVQASQLIGMKTKLDYNGVSGGSAPVKSAPISSGSEKPSSAVLPSNIQNLPDMVGGC